MCIAHTPPASFACSVDADCVRLGVSGGCVSTAAGSFCKYDECIKDGDCAAGNVCSCEEESTTQGLVFRTIGNQCVPANCQVDGDCGATPFCSPTLNLYCGATVTGYRCHTQQDQCMSDGDCQMDATAGACAYSSQLGYWTCTAAGFCAG
jgi:hypothetical protein